MLLWHERLVQEITPIHWEPLGQQAYRGATTGFWACIRQMRADTPRIERFQTTAGRRGAAVQEAASGRILSASVGSTQMRHPVGFVTHSFLFCISVIRLVLVFRRHTAGVTGSIPVPPTTIKIGIFDTLSRSEKSPCGTSVAGVRDSFPQISVDANGHQLSKARRPSKLWCASRSIVVPPEGWRRVTAGSPSVALTHPQSAELFTRSETALEDLVARRHTGLCGVRCQGGWAIPGRPWCWGWGARKEASCRLFCHGPLEKRNDRGQIGAQITLYPVTLNDVFGVIVGEPRLTFGILPD
jgi:hypothetical protein